MTNSIPGLVLHRSAEYKALLAVRGEWLSAVNLYGRTGYWYGIDLRHWPQEEAHRVALIWARFRDAAAALDARPETFL